MGNCKGTSTSTIFATSPTLVESIVCALKFISIIYFFIKINLLIHTIHFYLIKQSMLVILDLSLIIILIYSNYNFSNSKICRYLVKKAPRLNAFSFKHAPELSRTLKKLSFYIRCFFFNFKCCSELMIKQ